MSEKKSEHKLSLNPKLNTLEDVHRYYRKIISCMPNNVYWLDTNCIHLGCNNNVLKMVGVTEEEYIGKTYEELDKIAGWKEGVAESFQRDDKEVIRTGVAKLNVEEPPLYDKEGNPVYYISSRVPLFDDNKNVIGVVGISVDITKQKQTEKELAEQVEKTNKAYRSKAEFISIASHEIRNPIGNVIYGIDNLNERISKLKHSFYEAIEILNDAGRQDMVKNIQAEFKQIAESNVQAKAEAYRALNALINLGDLHRLQLEGVQPRYEISNISDLVHSAIDNSTYPNKNKVDIHLTINSSVPKEAVIDYSNIYEALRVIVGNAIRFSETEGIIKIGLHALEEQNKKFITIVVQDFGTGISESQLGHLFETHGAGTKIASTNKYWKPSLQLPQAKMKIEASGGVLEIKSALKQGTTVSMTIPYYESDLSDHGYSMIENKYANDICSLLLVEDDIYAQRIIKNYLEGFKHKVDVASTSAEGVEMAGKKDYDIILMDITLPDRNGVETMKEIQNKATIKPLFIAVTSHASENDVDDFITEGFVTVLTKPVNKLVLKKCIDDIMVARASDNDER